MRQGQLSKDGVAAPEVVMILTLKEAQLLVEMVQSAATANKKRPTWKALAKKLDDLECWV